MILETLFEVAARRPELAAIVTPTVSIGYGALVRAIRERAATLAPGVVTLRHDDPVACIVAVLALRLAGGVPLALGPKEADCAITAPLPPGTDWLRPTGGTTGAPSLVALREAQVLAAAHIHARAVGLEAGRAAALTLTPWTSYGSNCWLGALLVGATVRYVPAAAARDLIAALGDPTVVFGCTTPPVIRALARLGGTASDGRAPLLSAAAPYPDGDATQVRERHGVAVIDRYGSTEAGPIAQAREPGGPLWPVPEVRVQVDAASGTLSIASPAVALGTLGQPPLGGVFRSADGVAMAPDGSFRLRGRVDRVIKRMGRPVDVGSVERALASQPGVAFARVRVRPGALDVDLVAEVVPSLGQSLDAAALAVRLGEFLTPWQRPTRIEVLAAAPTDPTKWMSHEP